jgi:hypothetical protein
LNFKLTRAVFRASQEVCREVGSDVNHTHRHHFYGTKFNRISGYKARLKDGSGLTNHFLSIAVGSMDETRKELETLDEFMRVRSR